MLVSTECPLPHFLDSVDCKGCLDCVSKHSDQRTLLSGIRALKDCELSQASSSVWRARAVVSDLGI